LFVIVLVVVVVVVEVVFGVVFVAVVNVCRVKIQTEEHIIKEV